MSGAAKPERGLSRTFLDADLARWESYVSGGQPRTERAARIYFVCLEDPFEAPRWVAHESGSAAEATRQLAAMGDDDLVALLEGAEPLD